ncbi:hypothetical protein C900_02226 [Fulvivirga imtechensis AK7]|uniref:Uncharacterized protein n=2 Tax=Fulvivirga TaxID=396811 RepID=L8JSB0_9BACT|nr:hypothetical protein C900_02226 [Fulvivirga imtechensis AK7]
MRLSYYDLDYTKKKTSRAHPGGSVEKMTSQHRQKKFTTNNHYNWKVKPVDAADVNRYL